MFIILIYQDTFYCQIHSSITGLWDYIIFFPFLFLFPFFSFTKKFNIARESFIYIYIYIFLFNKMHISSLVIAIFFITFKKDSTNRHNSNGMARIDMETLVCLLTNSSMSRFKYHVRCLSLERARFIVARIARYAISNLNHFRRFHGKRWGEGRGKRAKE